MGIIVYLAAFAVVILKAIFLPLVIYLGAFYFGAESLLIKFAGPTHLNHFNTYIKVENINNDLFQLHRFILMYLLPTSVFVRNLYRLSRSLVKQEYEYPFAEVGALLFPMLINAVLAYRGGNYLDSISAFNYLTAYNTYLVVFIILARKSIFPINTTISLLNTIKEFVTERMIAAHN